MAIQVRRGNYADLDTSRLVQGEPFVTLDKNDDDYYVGVAITPSNVVRLATWNNLVDIRTDCETYRDEAHDSEVNAAASESNAATSEANAATYWGYVHDAINLVVPSVNINFITGELEVSGSSWYFSINQTTGNLEWAVSHV